MWPSGDTGFQQIRLHILLVFRLSKMFLLPVQLFQILLSGNWIKELTQISLVVASPGSSFSGEPDSFGFNKNSWNGSPASMC